MLWKMSQRSFTGGRLDKELMGRQDLAAYFKGASELKNFNVRRQGGISKRRGTNLACDLSQLGALTGCRLIPVVYDKTDGYYLLMYKLSAYSTNFLISILSKDGARRNLSQTKGFDRIFASPTSADYPSYFIDTGIPTVVDSQDVDLDKMDYMQSGDTVFIVHKLFPPKRIVFDQANLTLAIDNMPFNDYQAIWNAPTCTVKVYNGASTGTMVNYKYVATYYKDGVESVVSASVATGNFRWSAAGAAKPTYVRVTVTKGSNSTQPDKYCVYRDTGSGTFKKIGEITDTSGASIYFDDDNSATEGAEPPSKTEGLPTISVSKAGWDSEGAQHTVYYRATAVDADGNESSPSAVTSITYETPWPNTGVITCTMQKGTYSKTVDHYNVYKKASGIYGLIGTTQTVPDTGIGTFMDDYITPDVSVSPKEAEPHFATVGEYPSTIAMYQQRLVLCGTTNDPFTFHMSTTGDLYDFNVHTALREDDAIEATLPATEMPEINHAVMSRDLILFTTGGEWLIAPVTGNTISYKTVSAKMQSAIGSARWTKPVVIGDEIVFVDGSGENMLATRYSYTSDGYESKDLTILSRWIFHNNGISRICYKRDPDSSVVCVLNNGEIAELAYMKEHDVCAWSRHTLGGGHLAKDCAVSKAISNGTTDTMLLVSDASGSSWEAWSVRDDVPVRDSPSVADFVCMDGCESSTAAASFAVATGKTAVNTSTAAVYAAGETAPAGSYLIGYAFESKLVTVYPEPQGNDTIQMEVKNATEVEARVIDSCSFSIGANATPNNLRAITLSPTASNGVISLCDADVKLPVTGTNTRDGRIALVQSYPFTFNLTTINTTYQVEMSNLNGSGSGNGQ